MNLQDSLMNLQDSLMNLQDSLLRYESIGFINKPIKLITIFHVCGHSHL